MTSLIIPMAEPLNQNSNIRPKWLMTHPNGKFMGTQSITGLPLDKFNHIYFVTLVEYQNAYKFVDSFIKEFSEAKPVPPIDLVFLDKKTYSQPETVYQCIHQMNITGSILVKDSDNYFEADIPLNNNCICYSDLNEQDIVNARNKGYLQFDNNGFVNNIVEKKVISSTFSVGGYGFTSARSFCESFESFSKNSNELYMSNIIFDMILQGTKFKGVKTTNYEDWGTIEEWNRYKKTFKTLFVDLDGVLVKNTSAHFEPFAGTGKPLTNNIQILSNLYNKKRTRIFITTSRPDTPEMRKLTEEELKSHNIPYDGLIMGLPHAQRIIINDFAHSNPFPSCTAVNLERNSDTLGDYLV